MSKKVSVTLHGSRYHNDFSEYEYQNILFDSIYDIANELAEEGVEPNPYEEYKVHFSADDTDSDKDTTISFEIDLHEDEARYLNHLLTLKKDEREKLREEQYDSEEQPDKIAI